MNKFVKALKAYKMVEPVYNNLFEVRFKSDGLKYQDAVLMTEQVVRFGYSEGPTHQLFGLDFGAQFNTIDIVFNQNVIDKRIQPLATIEMLKDALDREKDMNPATLDINLYIHDREGTVLRKVRFFGCKVKSIDPGTNFNYEDQDIRELYVSLSFEKMSAENN